MKMFLLLSLLALATGCSRDRQEDRGRWDETFSADVVAINGEPAVSSFRVTFFNTDDDLANERYRIDSRCADFGYFDDKHGRFLSGTSPLGTDAEKVTDETRRDIADGPIRACGSNPASEFERILRIMQEGATLTEDRAGAARLSTPDGRSIDLIVSPRAGH